MLLQEESDIKILLNLFETIQELRNYIRQHLKTIVKDEADLSLEMLEILIALWRTDKVNQQQIADTIKKNKANVTPVLDKLVDKKLIIRIPDPSDRRNNIIHLTPDAEQLRMLVEPLLQDFHDKYLLDLPREDIRKTIVLLSNVNNKLSDGS